MNYSEACAWLRGERSMTNIIPQDPFETWLVRIAQADAAMMEQAFWIIRASKLFPEPLFFDAEINKNKSLDIDDTISDGFGASWPAHCSKCGGAKEVIRPGKIQCPNCG